MRNRFCVVSVALAIACLLLMGIGNAETWAHNFNNGYSYARIYENTVQYELLLPHPIMLQYDLDRNMQITDDELDRQKDALAAYMRDRLELFNGRQRMDFELLSVRSAIQESTEDPIVKFQFRFSSDTPVDRLTIRYNIIFDDIDPGHQNYIQVYKDGVLVGHRVVEKGGSIMEYVPDGRAVFSLALAGDYVLLGLQTVFKSVYFWFFLLFGTVANGNMKEQLKLALSLCAANTIGLLAADESALALPPATMYMLFAAAFASWAAAHLPSKTRNFGLPVSLVLALVHGMSSFAAVYTFGIYREYTVISLLLYGLGTFLGLAGFTYILCTFLAPLRKLSWHQSKL